MAAPVAPAGFETPGSTDASSTNASSTQTSSSRLARWMQAVPFILCHLAPLGAFWSGVTVSSVVICVVTFYIGIWAVTAGYHRYFAHRTFKTSRVFQFVLAFLAEMTAQKGALWWAAHHRDHHKHSDTERDVHSPVQKGFWYSHVGWLFDDTQPTKYSKVRDLEKYPELVWLNKYHLVPPTLLAIGIFLIWGWPGLLIGFFLSRVLLWHNTFFINSLAHVFGKRRFDTEDDSRNSLLLALMTLGEGWHNNHHHHMYSARQGFYWWEIDITYYSLKVLEKLGIVWDVREPPQSVLEEGRALDAAR